LESFKTITKERTRSSSTTFTAQKNPNSGLLHQDHQTSEIISMLKLRLITGLTTIDFGTKKARTIKSN